jgi:hypothetical protein
VAGNWGYAGSLRPFTRPDLDVLIIGAWLKSFITEVPVEFIAATEPFWSPQAPPSAAYVPVA